MWVEKWDNCYFATVKPVISITYYLSVAEGEGFEPPVPFPGTVVFKTTAIDHSAIPPRRNLLLNSRETYGVHLAFSALVSPQV